jgi:hypothetical protein
VLLTIGVDGSAEVTANFLTLLGPPIFATVIAVFWGAPLVAREYEQRTYLLVWSRDRPASRWLLARVAHLLVPGATLSGTLQSPQFDLWLPLQIATVLAGFALGVLVGVLVRNSVVSMGITLVGYVALRLVLGMFARRHYLAPVRLLDVGNPYGALVVSNGYLDKSGAELSAMDVQHACLGASSSTDFEACLAQHGVTHDFVDIQPVDRLGELRLIEFGVYGVLAVALLAAAWLVLRRRSAV